MIDGSHTTGAPPASSKKVARKSARKSSTRKSSTRKSSAKKSATKKNAADGTTISKRLTPASLRRQQMQMEEDRAIYTRKLDANLARLAAGTNVKGEPLTPLQITITENIVKLQRDKLEELDKLEMQLAEAEHDPRLAAPLASAKS